jgi:hypothetical protein
MQKLIEWIKKLTTKKQPESLFDQVSRGDYTLYYKILYNK